MSEHLAHGLAGDHTTPDWPPLTETEIRAVLAKRPHLGHLLGIIWHSPRPLSAAALVETELGPVFIKRHHQGVRDAVALAQEHAFASHLRSQGIPVPALIAQADGCTVSVLGEWVFEVHAPIQGNDLYRDVLSWEPIRLPAHAHAAGAMLARLHQAAHTYHAPQRSTHLLVAHSDLIRAADPVATLQAQLPDRPGLAAYLADQGDWADSLNTAMAPWHTRIQPRLATQPKLWTHGDWHVSNLAWSGTGADAHVSAVFDFGLCAENFALFDLATAIERNAIAWLQLDAHAARPRIALALIEGYHSQQPLTPEHIELLADLLPLVHVDFALSEVAYYHAITRSKAHADLAWFDFLQGHAAWFRSAAGKDFLNTIARWKPAGHWH